MLVLGGNMLKILRFIVSIIGILLAGFYLMTQNFELLPYLLFLLGILILIAGGIEIGKNKKELWGYLCILFSLLIFYVSILMYLYDTTTGLTITDK